MSESKGLKKNLSWTTIGMVLYNFAIWVFSALILRVLGANASGIYAIASSLGNTFYAVSLWGMRSFVVSDQDHTYSYGEYIVSRIIAIGLSILVMIIVVCISGYSRDIVLSLVFYSVFKFAESMIELFDCFGQQILEMDINARSMVLRGFIYTVIFASTLFLFHDQALSFLILSILSILILLFYNVRKFKTKINIDLHVQKEHIFSILKACFPIMGFELLASANIAIPRLFYENIGSVETLGIYTSIYTMVTFLQLVINVLIYTFAPYMAKAYQNKEYKAFKKYILCIVCGAIGLGSLAEILVFFIGKPVMSIVFGSEAGAYYTYLYLGIISGVTLTFTWVISQMFVIYQYYYSQLFCAIVSTIVCVILSMVMIESGNCDRLSIILILTNLSYVIVAIPVFKIMQEKKG